VNPLWKRLFGDHDIVGHKITIQPLPQGVPHFRIRFDNQVVSPAMDPEEGAKFPLRREDAGGKRLVITEAVEITGDLAVEIPEGISPRESQTDARRDPEGSSADAGPLQLNGQDDP